MAAGDEMNGRVGEGGEPGLRDPGTRAPGAPGAPQKASRTELFWDIPMSIPLPIEVQRDLDSAHRPFPFLDTTLADLGIQESEVKERVVWVDTKKTQVKNKAGKLKEKEITLLEVRVKAQKPGEKQLQEILYSTEAHTDRSFCRTGVEILPWMQRHTGESSLVPVKTTLPLDADTGKPKSADSQKRDI